MRSIQIGIEVQGGDAWIYKTCSFGKQEHNSLDSPLHVILLWVIEQLSLGCWQPRFDENGEAVSLVLGKDAAHDSFSEPIVEAAGEYAEDRHLAVNLAGLFAHAREAGSHTELEALIEQQRQSAVANKPSETTISDQIDAVHPANAWMNTEYHYAFHFVDLLSRLRERMFHFSAPPIRRKLPEAVSRQLAEATRAYLYGLNSAAVAICRALLEAALRERIDPDELLKRQSKVKRNELECLIDLGAEKQLFTNRAREQGHQIRRLGNQVIHAKHGREATEGEAQDALQQVRFILDELCT